MSKYHGEHYWQDLRSQVRRSWRDLSDDEFDTLQALRHASEVRKREQRARRYREGEYHYADV